MRLNCKKRVFFSGAMALSLSFILASQALAMTSGECTNQTNKGTCKNYCESTETQIGDCSDNSIATVCCSNAPAQQAATTPPASAPSQGGSSMTLADPLHGIGLYGILNRVIIAFLGIIGAVALLVFVYAGVVYMTAGSSDRVKKAMDAMKYAILGLIIIMMAYIITNFYFKALTTEPVSSTQAPQAQVTLPQTP